MSIEDVSRVRSRAAARRSVSLRALCAAIIPSLVWAAPKPNETERLGEVVVTASRAPEPLAQTLATVTVITRADIERSQAQSAPELLARSAGVSLTNNGGLGKATSLLIRGAESDQNLVLIDGVRVGSTTLGTAALQDLPLEQIERIEIVRGPRSALYGADALGGVVQLFTRRPAQSSGWRPEFTVGAGSHGTQRGSFGIGSGGERAFFRAGLSYLDTDGTNSCAGFGAPVFAGCFTDEPDRDGYRNSSGSLRAGLTLGDATRLEAFGLYSEGRTEYDGSFGNVAEFDQLTTGVSVAQPLGERWTLRGQWGRAEDNTQNFGDGTLVARFDTTRNSGSLLVDARLASQLAFTGGIDYVDDRVASDTQFAATERTTAGGFAQLRWTPGRQEWVVSARFDDNEQFGSELTGSGSWGMALAPNWRITASGGTAFKAPTFNELYFPDFGNPNLQPETSLAFETSIRYSRESVRASLTVYENRIDDLIGFDSNFTPVNIDQTRIRGIEAEAALQIRAVDVALLAEWADPENRSGALRGNVLPRRPKERARVEISAPLGPLRVGAVGQFAGERFDNLSNTRRLGSYALLDLLGEWRVRPHLLLQARLANAFDRDYATAAFYPQPGREIYVTLRFTP